MGLMFPHSTVLAKKGFREWSKDKDKSSHVKFPTILYRQLYAEVGVADRLHVRKKLKQTSRV
jgi:hypothetical protein